MIITRTPFRVSFAGGGSDLPCFFSEEPGLVLSTAVDKYMYVTAKERFGNTFRISYSKTELVDQVAEIQHPIVRECLRELGVTTGLELVSVADLPGRTGMGSSSSFTVGLMHALHAMAGHVVTPRRLAEEACRIEIDRLGEPIGKQDQFIAAFGGMQFIRFQPDGNVFVDPVICTADSRRELNRRLMLFFTGQTRSAREVLSRQTNGMAAKRPVLRKLCSIAEQLRDILTLGHDLNDFGHLLHEAWELKKSLEKTISNGRIDSLYQRGRESGALGGKLLGAGNGGFLLFYCEPHLQDRVRASLSELEHVPFSLDPEGTKVIFVGGNRW